MPRRRRADATTAEEQHLLRGAYDDEEPWDDGGFEFEEGRRRSGRRRAVGCLLPVILVAGVGYGGWQAYRYLENYFGGTSCQLRSGAGEEELSPEQAANAATIADLAVLRRDLPRRSATIGIATAIQESKLRNLTTGDRDSVGLFQQRPSQGWGTDEQILDPVYSAGKFYDKLVQVDDWQTRPLTEVAQTVQRSGFPNAYADHEGEGQVMADALTGAAPGGIGCRLDPASSASAPANVRDKLARQTGLRATARGNTLTVRADSSRAAWAVGAWGVAHAQAEGVSRVTVGDREWVRQRGRDGWSWQQAQSSTGSAQVVRIQLG